MIRSLLLTLVPLCAFSADLTGVWNFHLVRFGEEFAAARVELKSDGPKVTGTLNELKLSGDTDGDQLHIALTRPNGNEWGKLTGKVEGDRMSGTVKQGDEEFAWNAHRVPATPTTP